MGSGSDLAQPPVPVFLRTVRVQASGPTAVAAQQRAQQQAWADTGAGAWNNTYIAHVTVASLYPTAGGWHTDMWVTIKSRH